MRLRHPFAQNGILALKNGIKSVPLYAVSPNSGMVSPDLGEEDFFQGDVQRIIHIWLIYPAYNPILLKKSHPI
jgi:hypothetical protein